ncbi:peptidylprolyl isomerase [Paenibacillus hemerocallicola]|uniref:Peptidyl-prolyl cis-trans isomerase n=1 Tax=Paenibacillus hemerocallicola TaxID=1172614 RepID=A0A5C4TG76_9BACL|nr:peptidylprolyl isomerase [Paenibacillus hemerocallicola]TNJ68134.1 peptidylprolyl isomerase [Paenibacillus hemerocallicola]
MSRQRFKTLRVIAAVGAIALTLAGCGGDKTAGNANGNASGAKGEKNWSSPPPMTLKTDKKYEAVFDTTEGKFTVNLFNDTAPKTVNSFVFLSKEGFYNNVVFHRIMKTFMIQTGDPTGTGMGGPGYTIEDELKTTYKYDPGIVAMANTGAKNSGGSQFFICTGADCAASLNPRPNYTIFGQVTSGMEVVQKIAATPVKASPTGEPSVPTKEVKINKIDINEK